MTVPFLLFDISSGELFLIVLAVLILFGPRQIPVIARTIGKGVQEMRKASEQIRREVMQEADEIRNSVNTASPDENKPGQNELHSREEPSEKRQEPPAG